MADRGTAIHSAIETEDLSRCLEQEDIPIAKLCWRYLQRIRSEHAGHPFVESHEIEVPVLSMFGTTDYLLEDETSELIDWKTGYHGVTDAEFNPQLQGYLLGIWDTKCYIDRVRIHLFLPRRGEVSTHIYTREKDYERIASRIAHIIHKAQNPATYTPVWKACQYCGNVGNCAAYSKYALTLATQYKPEDLSLTFADPEALTTPEQIDQGFRIRKILERWNDAMYAKAIDHLTSGGELEHFKLLPVSGDRKITDVLSAWRIAEARGITLEEFLSACSASTPKLSEFVRAKAPKGQKGREADAFELELFEADCLELGATRNTIRAKTK